ncbi:MAG: sulfite exporter TauE/SafE family protein [Bacteroidia bacterium]|nr:sulfite exporter TauE/SafE family protein [Bacteroidia bacterium]
MQEYIGYACFVIIGLTLGLIGGGGSALAMPVLLYLLHYGLNDAKSYSLFIVGITALIGGISFLKRGDISIEAMYLFAIPSVIAVFCTRKFVEPALPETFFTIGDFAASKQFVLMTLFGIIILISSLGMIRKKKNPRRKDLMWGEFYRSPIHIPFIIVLGIAVGFLTGIFGVGGGFIIIPVLVIFLRVPMKKAIGTSLGIIAINSLIGFTSGFCRQTIDWKFLLIVSLLSVAGIFIGSYLSKFISGKKLKPAFGWFILLVGIFIINYELFLKPKQ